MPKRGQLDRPLIAVILLAAGWIVVAGSGNRSPESDLAAPGAPLYQSAVTESVKSLMSKEEQTESRPPSPGPGYFWCENCKTYHQRQPSASSAGQSAAVSTPGSAAAQPGQPHTAAKPPSPGPDSYWCEQCKTYHLRQTPVQQPGTSPAARQTNAAVSAVGTVAAQAPGGDYYYCENCKTYHRRQPVAQQSTGAVSRVFGGGSNTLNMSPLLHPAGTER